MTHLRVGISLGDPGGIGPEIVLKSLAEGNLLPPASYIIFGSRLIVEQEKKALGIKLNLPLFSFSSLSDLPPFCLFEVKNPVKSLQKGISCKENGQASFLFFQKAVEEAQKGTIQALITAPISKHSWNLAGIKWLGHTEYLAHLFPQAIMSFWSPKLKVVLYTHHLSLSQALPRIKKNPLFRFLLHLYSSIEEISPQHYSYLTSGLNPHAGEEGLLGSEEKEEISPAIKQAQKEGMPIEGPFPPDTVFRKALNQEDKIVVALYHDQGLIPFKLVAFEEGVNVTLGLPFIRTSPDHGTALDIAPQRKARPHSLGEAIRLALQLSSPRKGQ